jgi:hypothetical protein
MPLKIHFFSYFHYIWFNQPTLVPSHALQFVIM